MTARSRKWSRFKVAPDRKLRARIMEGVDKASSLNSIGLGGCSFFTGWRDAQLLQKPQVRVEVKVGEDTILIEGVVHYCKFIPNKSGNLVGIEFKWSDDQKRKLFGTLIGKAVIEGNLEHSHPVEV